MDIANKKILFSGKKKSKPIEINFSEIMNVVVFESLDMDGPTQLNLVAILRSFETVDLTAFELKSQGTHVSKKLWAARLYFNAQLENARNS